MSSVHALQAFCTKVVIHFCCAPEDEMDKYDLAEMFGYDYESVTTKLQGAVDMGYLSIKKNGARNVYTAGPRIATRAA